MRKMNKSKKGNLTVFFVIALGFISIRIVDSHEGNIHLLCNGMDNSGTKSTRSAKGSEPEIKAISVFHWSNSIVFEREIFTNQLESGGHAIFTKLLCRGFSDTWDLLKRGSNKNKRGSKKEGTTVLLLTSLQRLVCG